MDEGVIWLIVYLAVFFNAFMFWSLIAGLWRWHDQRLERQILDRLGESIWFLVPREER